MSSSSVAMCSPGGTSNFGWFPGIACREEAIDSVPDDES
jgi:hypothetical protein